MSAPLRCPPVPSRDTLFQEQRDELQDFEDTETIKNVDGESIYLLGGAPAVLAAPAGGSARENTC
jgi:hypothetical protein